MLTDNNGIMQERLNSLLNNSLSKQAYSFGKQLFKKNIRKDNIFQFYNI